MRVVLVELPVDAAGVLDDDEDVGGGRPECGQRRLETGDVGARHRHRGAGPDRPGVDRRPRTDHRHRPGDQHGHRGDEPTLSSHDEGGDRRHHGEHREHDRQHVADEAQLVAQGEPRPGQDREEQPEPPRTPRRTARRGRDDVPPCVRHPDRQYRSSTARTGGDSADLDHTEVRARGVGQGGVTPARARRHRRHDLAAGLAGRLDARRRRRPPRRTGASGAGRRRRARSRPRAGRRCSPRGDRRRCRRRSPTRAAPGRRCAWCPAPPRPPRPSTAGRATAPGRRRRTPRARRRPRPRRARRAGARRRGRPRGRGAPRRRAPRGAPRRRRRRRRPGRGSRRAAPWHRESRARPRAGRRQSAEVRWCSRHALVGVRPTEHGGVERPGRRPAPRRRARPSTVRPVACPSSASLRRHDDMSRAACG